MKYSSLCSFEGHLKAALSSGFSHVYLVNAKEELERLSATKSLLKALLQGREASLVVKIFDASLRLEIKDVMEELESKLFFEGNSIVVIHHVDKLDKEGKKALQAYLLKPNKSVHLLLTLAQPLSTTTLYKRIEKIGVVLPLFGEKPWEKEKHLIEWIVQRIQEAGKEIDRDSCQNLLKRLSGDKSLLLAEIEKLICYTGERKKIVNKDISLVCVEEPSSVVWQLGEAIFQRDISFALDVVQKLTSQGHTIFVLIPQLRRQFQIGFSICSIIKQGGGSLEIVKAFPYMKGKILEKNILHAKNYGMECYRKAIVAINEVDVLSKNSQISPALLLEKLLINLGSMRE